MRGAVAGARVVGRSTHRPRVRSRSFAFVRARSRSFALVRARSRSRSPSTASRCRAASRRLRVASASPRLDASRRRSAVGGRSVGTRARARTAIAIDRRCVRVETAISISIARSIKDKNARVRRGTTSRADAALGGRGAMTRASKRKAAAPVATTKSGARGAMRARSRARETGARDGRKVER